jgi:pterin-4a-carbinolamine dehydratase
MKEYFGGIHEEYSDQKTIPEFLPVLLQEQKMPLAPAKIKWHVLDSPERFTRKFKFDDRRRLLDFVTDVLAYEDEVKHHGELKIAGDVVEVSVYTHTLEQITELDREYVRSIDKILRDVLDYRYEG